MRKQSSSRDANNQKRLDLPCSNFKIQITSQGFGGDWGGGGNGVRYRKGMQEDVVVVGRMSFGM